MTTSHLHKTRALEGYLVAAARTGDTAALDQLIRLLSPRLLAHAARLTGDREAAKDIVQSAWIDIMRALPGLRAVGAFRAFALQITSRKAARHLKQRKRDQQIEDELTAEPTAFSRPLGDVQADAARLRKAIDALPPAQSATLALFYLEDLSVADVATALDVPSGTVKTRLMHARRALRRALKGDHDDEA